jgi:hypothetical protein
MLFNIIVFVSISLYYTVTGSKCPEIQPDWWGNKYGFVSGGFLGAASKKKKSSTSEIAKSGTARTPFFEQDQEDLYNLVQVCAFQTLYMLYIILSNNSNFSTSILKCHLQLYERWLLVMFYYYLEF